MKMDLLRSSDMYPVLYISVIISVILSKLSKVDSIIVRPVILNVGSNALLGC